MWRVIAQNPNVEITLLKGDRSMMIRSGEWTPSQGTSVKARPACGRSTGGSSRSGERCPVCRFLFCMGLYSGAQDSALSGRDSTTKSSNSEPSPIEGPRGPSLSLFHNQGPRQDMSCQRFGNGARAPIGGAEEACLRPGTKMTAPPLGFEPRGPKRTGQRPVH